ncbi:HNH endonuclease [Bacillus phage G]|uniref:Gp576 n=1 Tax=Bacillus phage G TaxID=2884420 RepID=G3MAV6_9CAUD|nr:HNH endonuclease [Bacillus phage G]AEO93821.1 gp576 [Bacillus phage G]
MALSVEDRLVKSRVQLLMHFPFFGTLALHLQLRERKDIPTAATDGRSYFFNPDWCGRLDDKELNFLTAHEVLHPALGHLWRRGGRDPIIWNHAADYCINAMIKECDPDEKHFKMIVGGLYDKKFEGMFSEEIYDILIKDEDYVKKAHANAANGNGGTIDSHDEWGKAQAGDENGDTKGNTPQDWEGRTIQAAKVAENNEKNRGKMPGAIKRLIKDLVEPQKNWKELLAEFVQPEINDYGWNPPNQHHIWRDIYLPDFNEEVDTVKNLVFAIDTSGSIGEHEIRTFISEIIGCMNQFSGKVKGHLVYCDARVAAVYDLEDTEHSTPAGGGGTAFEPVFQWVEENLEECSGVAYLTDMYASFDFKIPNYPVLWASTTKNMEAPWGTTTYLDVRI